MCMKFSRTKKKLRIERKTRKKEIKIKNSREVTIFL